MGETTQRKDATSWTRDGEWSYATKPTRWTLFWRTFLPWQAWRFVWLNVKMLKIIGRGHRGQ